MAQALYVVDKLYSSYVDYAAVVRCDGLVGGLYGQYWRELWAEFCLSGGMYGCHHDAVFKLR